MANMIKKNDFGSAKKQIMIADELMISLPVRVAATGAVTVGSRKIIKAGTPIKGDYKNRNTAFTKEATNPVGILLHDVDVTDGEDNGVAVMFGVVDLEKLEADTQALITSTVETALSGKVFFTTGSGNALS